MKKNDFRNFTVACLSGIMLAATISPAFAGDYSSPYSAEDYSYDYKYDSSNVQQQPVYQQQAPAYAPVNQNYSNPAPPPQYGAPQYSQNYQQGQNNYQPPQYQPVPNYSQAPQVPNYNNTIPVQNNYNLPPLQGRVVTVPPGTMITGATTTRELSSSRLRTGDTVSVTMNTPFYYGGAQVLPAGTNIIGTVVQAEKAGRAGKNGQLMIVFNQGITPSGQRVALTGKLDTEDGTGLLKGGTGMDRAKEALKDTAVGAGSGALLGTVFGAVSGGSAGKGAALGTAIGGGTGLAKTIIDKGKDVVIGVGERLNIILDSELRVGEEPAGNSLPGMPSNYNY